MLDRDHPLAGMFDPRLSPEELDRVTAVARERFRAMSAADIERESRANRREYRKGAVRAWIRWILHL
jgi:hypothetical protein